MRRARANGEHPSVYGWKLASNDMRWHPSRFPDPAGFLRHSTGDDGLLVVLRRRNFTAQALSWMHAEANSYHYTSSDTNARFQKMTLDPEELLSQTFTYELEDRWIAKVTADLDRLDLFYEDDLIGSESQQVAVDRITRALGLASVAVQTNLKRIAPLNPADRIDNIDDVRRVFEPTRFSHLLDSA